MHVCRIGFLAYIQLDYSNILPPETFFKVVWVPASTRSHMVVSDHLRSCVFAKALGSLGNVRGQVLPQESSKPDPSHSGEAADEPWGGKPRQFLLLLWDQPRPRPRPRPPTQSPGFTQGHQRRPEVWGVEWAGLTPPLMSCGTLVAYLRSLSLRLPI